jgi:hypothetical protein
MMEKRNLKISSQNLLSEDFTKEKKNTFEIFQNSFSCSLRTLMHKHGTCFPKSKVG